MTEGEVLFHVGRVCTSRGQEGGVAIGRQYMFHIYFMLVDIFGQPANTMVSRILL
jgi:hypothetical protein